MLGEVVLILTRRNCMTSFDDCKHERTVAMGPVGDIDVCKDCGATREMSGPGNKPQGWIDFPKMAAAALTAGNEQAAYHSLLFMELSRENHGVQYPATEEFAEQYLDIVPDPNPLP